MNIPTPANSQIFFGSLLNIAAFDILETLADFDDRLNLHAFLGMAEPTSEPLPGNFLALGYDSTNFIDNIGSLIIFYVIFPVYILGLAILRKVIKKRRKTKKLHRKLNYLLQRVFFNDMLTFIEDTYLIVVVCCFARFHQALYDDDKYGYDFILALCAFTILVIYIIFLIRIKNFSGVQL